MEDNSVMSRARGVAAALLLGLALLWQLPAEAEPFGAARREMVREQLQARGIEDERVLRAMRSVRRHLFVPPHLKELAYADRPLPIGHEQTISQPYIVALMTELAHVDPEDRVLEIGTGSGYQAAVLAELCRRVYSVEIIEPLAREARQRLERLGYENVAVRCGDGFKGWGEHAPYDAVLVTCAPPDIPPPLIEQLAEGGRLVIPVGELWQELKVVTKKSGRLQTEDIVPVRFVPMTGEGVQRMQ
jgi:protein-L-isoaspartate(D-aspartate) O-methyltransferase